MQCKTLLTTVLVIRELLLVKVKSVGRSAILFTLTILYVFAHNYIMLRYWCLQFVPRNSRNWLNYT